MKTPTTSRPSRPGQPSRRPNAFTLIELLVVIIIIGILAALLLPVLAAAKAKGQGITCVNNLHQLTIAWTSYSTDNRDWLAQNTATDWGGSVTGLEAQYQPGQPNASWVLGCATNNHVDLIKHGLVYQYLGNYLCYKCPADLKTSPAGVPASMRLRSYSMNAWMNGVPPWKTDQVNFRKSSSIVALSTANAWVFMEENQATINDGSLVEDVPQNEAPGPPYWVDNPGHYHINSGAISFADGHTQIRKWTDRYILADTPQTSNGNFPGDPTSPDLAWVLARSTIKN